MVMAKIKLTKNELKLQRDGLKRFERFLPTLQLKKQQLQLEVRRVRDELDELTRHIEALRQAAERWVHLFDGPSSAALDEMLEVEQWQVEQRNIAGIDTTAFVGLTFADLPCDLFATPSWFDDARATIRTLVEVELHRLLLHEQVAVLEEELHVVTQRVNLFEKVKIPEARENIRRVQIYLGDQQTNAVGRAKIAKEKTRVRDAATAAAVA